MQPRGVLGTIWSQKCRNWWHVTECEYAHRGGSGKEFLTIGKNAIDPHINYVVYTDCADKSLREKSRRTTSLETGE